MKGYLQPSFILIALGIMVVSVFLLWFVNILPLTSYQKVEQEVGILIGLSQANLSEPWRISMTEEITQQAKLYPDMRVVITDAVDSSERQVDDVRRLLAYGIDLLIISPTDSQVLTPVVTEAYKTIPVIVLDRAVEGYDYTLYIGPDNQLIGRETGRSVSELLGKSGGTVWEIQGRAGSPPTIDRSTGLRQEIERHPGIRLTKTVTADWLRDQAEDALSALLAKSPIPDVIVSQNDAMAYGAILATKKAGIKNIKFIGVDGLEGANGGLDLVRKGLLTATFICPTGGKEAVNYAWDILEKKPGIPKKIYLRTRKITAETVNTNVDPYASFRHPRSNKEPIRLGFAQVGSESRWRLTNTKSIKDAARDAGIELIFVDGQQKQEKQIEAIRSFIRQKVDIIAFSPIVESGWEPVLQEAKEAGIPVILSDREVDIKDDSLWATFIGSDFLEEGRRAARWLLSYMQQHPTPDGIINIVELQGTVGSAPALDRKRGFETTLAAHKEYRIIRSEIANFYFDQGRDVMKRILETEQNRIDVLFAHNDDMALGAIQSIEAAGLNPGKDIVIVSVDAVKEAFQAMIAGKLNCTVECTPLLGPQLMKVIQDYFDGKELPTRIITSEEVFPAEVARAVLPKRRY
ncbi:MAG: substrate-binding domain-containing protein [Treponema sp.]|nr:substrate-binding domain-containing protein [Treponema sp.]